MNPNVPPIIIDSTITTLSIHSETTDATDTSVELSPVSPIYSHSKWNIDEIEMVFRKHGYTKIKKICNTLQGDLYMASIINHKHRHRNKQSYVAIKKTNKYLYQQRIAIEDDINFCVSENIIKEALIMKYLTVDNTPIGDYIVKYIDFFESNSDYFLVMEYVESEMNLKQFISKAREYIKCGKLSLTEYHKMIKYVLWQLFVTVQWLHSMRCCHMDLCPENIMLKNATFIKRKHRVCINTAISIKLSDFGVGEVFYVSNDSELTSFQCEKQGLSIHNEGYFAPKVFNGDIYDARYADNWCLGIILFECMTVGKQLYNPLNMYHPNGGYVSLFRNQLFEYLSTHNLLKYFCDESESLLIGLLNVNQWKRFKGVHILKHKWFKPYFKRYNKQIVKKFVQQKQRLSAQQYKMKRFPFYH